MEQDHGGKLYRPGFKKAIVNGPPAGRAAGAAVYRPCSRHRRRTSRTTRSTWAPLNPG